MKIKKMYQGTAPENKILNTHSDSQTDVYSCDYINKLNTYSTEEQVIGTWIDGKPLYRKVCELGSLPNNPSYYDIGITNENATPINWTLLGHWSFGWKQYVDGPDLITSLRSDGFLLETQIDMSGCTGILIIEYTKTTD